MAARRAQHRLILLLASAAAIAGPAFAQADVQRFDIPSRSLSAALRAYSQASGQQILFPEAMVANKRSESVRGELNPDEALRILLRGSGLEWRRTTDGVILLQPQKAVATKAVFQRQTSEVERAPDVARPTPPPLSLDEIIVTAQLRDQRLQDVPLSVSITSGVMLERSNITSLSDLSSRLPNVRITSAPGANLLNIRGVGSGLNAGFEQAVGTFVDGVYRGRSRAAAAALFDVERVEILRGPQTTFFGNNVIAGALNITTRKPHGREGAATLLYSPATDEYSAEAAISLPLGDTAGVRLAGRLFGMNGYVKSEALGDDVPRRRDALGRVSFYWEPSDRFRSDVRVDVTRLRGRGDPAMEGVNCPADPIYGPPRGTCLLYLQSGLPVDDTLNYVNQGYVGFTHYDMVEFAATNKLRLDHVSLTSITGYFHHKMHVTTNAAPFPVLGVGGTPSRTVLDFYEGVTQFSQELRLASNSPGPIQFMMGGYYAYEKVPANAYAGVYSAPFGAAVAPIYNASTPISSFGKHKQIADNYSAFASIDADLVADLKLSLGLRYTHIHKRIDRDLLYGVGGTYPLTNPFVPGPPQAQIILLNVLGGTAGNYPSPSRTDSKLMPSVKLQYDITPNVMGYVSYTKGFKAGGYAFSAGNFELDPENVDAYEAGLKATLLDRRLFVSASAYRSEYKNLQESTQTVLPSGTIVAVVTNAASTRAEGLEFGASFRLNRNIDINADLAYLDSVYRDYPNAPCTVLASITVPNCIQNMSGKRRAFAPKFSGSVGMTLTEDLTDTMVARLDSLIYFTSHYYQSATADPLLSQEGYAKLDMRLGVGPSDRRWEAAVIGKNLTNKKTASFRNQFAGSPGSVWLVPEPPRSVAFQVSAKF